MFLQSGVVLEVGQTAVTGMHGISIPACCNIATPTAYETLKVRHKVPMLTVVKQYDLYRPLHPVGRRRTSQQHEILLEMVDFALLVNVHEDCKLRIGKFEGVDVVEG